MWILWNQDNQAIEDYRNPSRGERKVKKPETYTLETAWACSNYLFLLRFSAIHLCWNCISTPRRNWLGQQTGGLTVCISTYRPLCLPPLYSSIFLPDRKHAQTPVGTYQQITTSGLRATGEGDPWIRMECKVQSWSDSLRVYGFIEIARLIPLIHHDTAHMQRFCTDSFALSRCKFFTGANTEELGHGDINLSIILSPAPSQNSIIGDEGLMRCGLWSFIICNLRYLDTQWYTYTLMIADESKHWNMCL